jgi:hypothetical protein
MAAKSYTRVRIIHYKHKLLVARIGGLTVAVCMDCQEPIGVAKDIQRVKGFDRLHKCSLPLLRFERDR